MLGLALAYLGRNAGAIREGARGAALGPVLSDARMARSSSIRSRGSNALVGEPEKAIDRLEELLKMPYFLLPGWLTSIPNFDPLRNNPRFQKLVAGAKEAAPPNAD